MINKVMSMIFGMILLLVGIIVLLNVGPQLLGMTVTNAATGYISNATGCYIDMTTPTSDVPANGIYCSGFSLYPILLIVGFFVSMVVIIMLYFKGLIGGKK